VILDFEQDASVWPGFPIWDWDDDFPLSSPIPVFPGRRICLAGTSSSPSLAGTSVNPTAAGTSSNPSLAGTSVQPGIAATSTQPSVGASYDDCND